MKRIISLFTIAMLVCSLSVGSVFAASAHGEDAHSPSMSVGSGETPVEDESATKEAGGGTIDDSEPVMSEEAAQKEKEAAEAQAKAEAEAEAEQAKADSDNADDAKKLDGKDLFTTISARIFIIIGVGLALFIMAIVAAVASIKEKQSGYTSKH